MIAIPRWGYSGFSAVVAISILDSTQRWAELGGISRWWWLPSWRIFKDAGFLTFVGVTIFGVAMFPLWWGIARRSHALLAAATALSTVLVYIVMLRLWSARPGPIIDPRVAFTMSFSVVPLYVSLLAIAGHLHLWIQESGMAQTPKAHVQDATQDRD